MTGVLYLVATPIGNLGDMSIRAAQTLEDADFIAAEDTRVTRKLLEHLNIKKHLLSYHEHNSRESGEKIISRLLTGENCALVTDAGTPIISDPGERLVSSCIDAGVQIVSIPGPCAAITALALSGLPAGRFTFEGFLSTARKSRFERLSELKSEKRTMIFYEAPHKLKQTLKDFFEIFGNRRISISRELTKIYEETIRMTLSDAVAYYEQNQPRGEFVLIIEGAFDEHDPESGLQQAVAIVNSRIGEGSTLKDAVKEAADETGISKNAIYNAAITNSEPQTRDSE